MSSKAVRELADKVHNECIALGATSIKKTTVEKYLTDVIREMADRLDIQPASVLPTYRDAFDVKETAEILATGSTLRQREIEATEPVTLPLAKVGQLMASLGQAVRCVSLNHETIIDGPKWELIGVLDDAGNGMTMLGALLHDASSDAITLDAETVVYVRGALQRVVTQLTKRKWRMYDGRPDIDSIVAERMTKDLALLPSAPSSL